MFLIVFKDGAQYTVWILIDMFLDPFCYSFIQALELVQIFSSLCTVGFVNTVAVCFWLFTFFLLLCVTTTDCLCLVGLEWC